MTENEKPPFGLTPRHLWFRKRVMECIDTLKRLEEIEDWDIYKEKAMLLSSELHYASTEWEKYYK